MSRSVVMGIHAIGKMKMVNLLAGTTLLLSLPVSFVLFKMSISLEIVMIVTLLPWFIETFIELTLMKKYVGLSRRKFYIQSYGIIILIGGIMCIPLLVISSYMNEGYIRFLVNMSISTVLGGILIYFFGITANMRVIINDKIKSLINK